jgi:hypothetical protein
MPPVGFEPTILVSERPKTHALDRTATGHHTERDGAAAHHSNTSLPELLPAMEGPLG